MWTGEIIVSIAVLGIFIGLFVKATIISWKQFSTCPHEFKAHDIFNLDEEPKCMHCDKTLTEANEL